MVSSKGSRAYAGTAGNGVKITQSARSGSSQSARRGLTVKLHQRRGQACVPPIMPLWIAFRTEVEMQ